MKRFLGGFSPSHNNVNKKKEEVQESKQQQESKQNELIGLGLGLTLSEEVGVNNYHNGDCNTSSRRSKHVQFDSTNISNIHHSTILSNKNSFESTRHGGGRGSGISSSNCFSPVSPNSTKSNVSPLIDSNSSSTSHSTKFHPGPPQIPLLVAGSLIASSHSNTTVDELMHNNSIGLGRPPSSRTSATSPILSLSPPSFSGTHIPASFSKSKGTLSPYSWSELHPSLARVSERDPTQINAPPTWSQMATPELVENVSGRERTKQEILWEIVASEERYVLELRSLVSLYVQPLLHPLLTPPSSPPNPHLPIKSTSSPPSIKSVTSKSPLPIAGKFLRTVEESNYFYDTRSNQKMPEIISTQDGSNRSDSVLSNDRNSHTPTGYPSPPSSPPPDSTRNRSGRISSMSSTFRHPLRPADTNISSKLLKPKSHAPTDAFNPPIVPEGLKKVLIAVEEMLVGHEALSGRLREQWMRAFPLVRGLGEIWSSQPFFLPTYAAYVLSLEEALATLDHCLPSSYSHTSLTSTKATSNQAKSNNKSNPLANLHLSKEELKLANFTMMLEERAAEEGESSMAICLSKPLMRLGKLPLLMQSLLYYTDATASFEYEKTRVMALEIDGLVRSIEDEKIEEEEREKVRDLLARIEGIKDKDLMAPRSSRILIEEVPLFQFPSTHPPVASPPSRRSVSDPIETPQPKSKSTARRISDFLLPSHSNSHPNTNTSEAKKPPPPPSKSKGGKNDLWLIILSDVVIRCRRIGTTDIPGGFVKGKKGKVEQRGSRAPRVGQVRNLYRFIRIEKWEIRDGTASNEGKVDLSEEEESIVSNEEEEDMDAESVMSFSYENDDPKPLQEVRNFKSVATQSTASRPSSSQSQPVVNKGLSRKVSISNKAVVNKEAPAVSKFAHRLPSGAGNDAGGFVAAHNPPSRALSPTPSTHNGKNRFNNPTAASTARKTLSALSNNTLIPSTSMPSVKSSSARVPPPRINSPSQSDISPLKSPSRPFSGSAGGGGGGMTRDDSGINLYEVFWRENATLPLVPSADSLNLTFPPSALAT